MQKSSGGANEQGSREKLAWLAGIIDGEGSISIGRLWRETPKGRVLRAYHPRVYVSNTDFKMIEVIALILEAHGIRYYANPTTNVRPKLQGRKECKFMMMITVSGMKTCTALLELVIPYMVTKKRQAEFLLEYCIKRKAEMREGEWRLQEYVQGSTPPNMLGEFYIGEICKERAIEYDPSETTRRPSYFRLKTTEELG